MASVQRRWRHTAPQWSKLRPLPAGLTVGKVRGGGNGLVDALTKPNMTDARPYPDAVNRTEPGQVASPQCVFLRAAPADTNIWWPKPVLGLFRRRDLAARNPKSGRVSAEDDGALGPWAK
jgi:hypothetical protein